MEREKTRKNPQDYFFLGGGACRPYKPSAVLSRKGTGRREMTERRDTEKPRYRDAEFHRERPELRAKNPVLHHFCDFTGFVPASKGPGSEQLFDHWWSFLVPYPIFLTKHRISLVFSETHGIPWFFEDFPGTRFLMKK